jgi:TPR repeat protein
MMKNIKKIMAVVMVVGMGRVLFLYTMNPSTKIRPKDLYEQANDFLYPPMGKMKDYGKALAIFQKVAAQHDDPLSAAEAKLDLAAMYKDGLGIPQNKDRARNYFNEARSAFEQMAANAETNPKAAAFATEMLGDIYYYGNRAETDEGMIYAYADWVEYDEDRARQYYEKARTLLEQVIEQYDPESVAEANLELGYMYQFGYFRDTDYDKARPYYERVAHNKQLPLKLSIEAYESLALMYRNGQGEEALGQNIAKAIDYYNRIIALAGQAGKPESAYQAHMAIGDIYAYGIGIDHPDFNKARLEYEKIGELPNAQEGLAYLYRHGQGRHFPPDINLAEYCYKNVIANPLASDELKKSAKKELASIFYSLGYNHYYGEEGVSQDYVLAREYFNQLLALGEAGDNEKAVAHNFLGKMSYEGQVGAKNYAEARNHFDQSLAIQDTVHSIRAEAEFYLGKIYYEGQAGILAQDYLQAFGYFTQVIANQDASGWMKAAAKAYIGRMYYRGQGVARNYTQAGVFSQNALGSTDLLMKERAMAHYTLGMMYYYGQGVHRDLTFVADYFNLVVQNPGADPAEKVSAQNILDAIPQANPESVPVHRG